MKYLATLDGEHLGEITIGEMQPNIGDKVRLRYKEEPVDAFIHTQEMKFPEGAIVLHCVRPETWMKGDYTPPVPPPSV